MQTEGYLLCVFGTNSKYYDLSVRFIENIRKFDKYRPICILTDNVSLVYQQENVNISPFFLEKHLHPIVKINNDWNQYGFYPKVFQSLYTPFEHTMYMDVDMLFHRDFTFIWDIYHDSKQSILIPGKSDENNRSPSDWHWGKIDQVIDRIHIPIPQTFSTVIVYDRDVSKLIDKYVSYILDHLEEWHVQFQFRDSGLPDEIVYSIILGMEKIRVNREIHDWVFDENNCNPCCK